MFTILIVDDEAEIRDGLASLNWPTIGYEIAGVGAHGLEALALMEERPVDVILTDIRMPFMDGIQLLGAIKEKYPFVKVIILSGYDDFEYAKQALKLGASDYLLKPTIIEDLFAIFKELHRKMINEKQIEYRQATLERKERLLSRMLRVNFLKELLAGMMSQDDIEQSAAEAEFILSQESDYQVSILSLDRLRNGVSGVGKKEFRLIVFSLDNMLSELWEAKDLGYHYVDPETARCYFIGRDIDSRDEMLKLKKQLGACMGLWQSTFTIGIGVSVTNIEQVHVSYRSAELALASSGEGNRLCIGEYVDVDNRTGISEPVMEDSPSPKGAHYIIEEAKKYVRQNYSKNVTLKKVAEHVHVTPNYLSALFKETGENYIQFLTVLRIEQAKTLLKDPGNKIYEVVEMVGYSDPAYFSATFKKFVGKTPLEYRLSMEQ
ncbi:response regulator [Paenibacillus harenae]|uniref:response regulator n=1 Tax=Paenibacillus harenae TaxID=306543 RepID=UPI000429259A|nr:response regulator [Paenibacillus harenae]